MWPCWGLQAVLRALLDALAACHSCLVITCGFEVARSTWDDYDFERSRLQNGYIFATQQEAQAVADALNSIYKKAVDEAWKS